MPCIWLDVSLEVCSWHVWEILLYCCWDGGEGGVAGCEAVAAAVGEVVCCEDMSVCDLEDAKDLGD